MHEKESFPIDWFGNLERAVFKNRALQVFSIHDEFALERLASIFVVSRHHFALKRNGTWLIAFENSLTLKKDPNWSD